MERKLPFVILGLFFCLAFAGCTLFGPKEAPVDYHMLEQTAIIHLTQTFEAQPTSTSTNTPEPTATPVPTATEIPTEEPDLTMIRRPEDDGGEFLISRPELSVPTDTPEPTATVYFPDKADFVSALPSPNQFLPGQHFYLTWQIKNTGTSTWSGKYRFNYQDGIHLADSDNYAIDQVVAPGETLTITMPATAPNELGTYKTTWVLENPDGIPFYYLNFTSIVGDRTFITAVPSLNPTATPASLSWMCSDPERSLIQGDGCTEYCVAPVVQQMESEGQQCYANGESVVYGE